MSRLLAGLICLSLLAPWAALSAWGAEAASSGPDPTVVDEKTERVIQGALKFLASRQAPDGSWSMDNREHHVAFTGYVLIAFMSTGNLPDEGPYAKNVTNGMHYLLSCVEPTGYIHKGNSNMYSHGIATIALAEMYGQSHDNQIRPKLEKAVKLICGAQNPAGGWRYQPQPTDADISVTVLQVVALRAAKNAGLDVPQTTIDKAVKYVQSCQHAPTGGFCYQPGQGPGFARTAAAIYSLQVCGQYQDPRIAKGSEFLFKHVNDGEWWTYGNFYAAPAEYMIGGDSWVKWYSTISKRLMEKVEWQGDSCFWHPIDPQGVHPLYATAVYTTILAMPYHYLPLYQR